MTWDWWLAIEKYKKSYLKTAANPLKVEMS
jgi:hypothetical protein